MFENERNLKFVMTTRNPNWDGSWPEPVYYVKYEIVDTMRADILKKLGRPEDDPCILVLEEEFEEGGYSEFTVEMDHRIRVFVVHNNASDLVFSSNEADEGSYVKRGFFNWVLGVE